ncbi:EmrB/QacA subfamily drug resistance transporter [Antricoccus suffuscus]|uniref:EmrB/QacA subfamily drug resistance transporter n=1 Tax=Antricoccus suffuscus TaxID=1629062 RepID=A0A2T0ZVS9_9ACTN|nr:MFS transporter [Antricoccus suffuscus]PRZ40452.1 EmrB/QacA subfamily drug resistance transporter [Antricoccus suffuscus]
MARPATSTGAWLTLLVAAAGQFLSVVSTTVVSVALPTMGEHLDASATDLQWIVDSYVLVLASLLMTGGVLGDRLGRKGVFMVGIAIFATGSLMTGLAPTIEMVLIGRVIQAIGPALLVPGSLNIVRAAFDDPARRAFALGLWSTSSGLAMAVGPIVGGVIVDGWGWRWVFLINVPLSLLLIAIAARYVPRLAKLTNKARFDLSGAVLTIVGVGALAFAIIEGQNHGWGSPLILGMFALSLVTLTIFVLVERRLADPLIDVRLYLLPRFAAANIAGLVVFFAFTGSIVYFSAYFQQVQGLDALHAGINVAALGIAFAVASTVSGHLVGRIGAKWPLLIGLVVCAAGTLGLLRLDTTTPGSLIWWNFAIFGFGIGLSMSPMAAIAMAAVDASHAGMASAILNSVRQVGQLLGVAVLGALVYANIPGRSGGGARLNPRDQESFVSGLHAAMWTSAVALLIGAVLSALLFRVEAKRERTVTPVA